MMENPGGGGGNRYFLSLGSNVGDRSGNLARALAALKKGGVRILRASSLYLTEPVGYGDQRWFCNQAVEVSTSLEPAGLLALIHKVENDLGRRPARRNRPRTIDIDILMAGDRTMATGNLVIPHLRMTERNFVLFPLLEIAPAAVHPILQKTISDLSQVCPDKSAVKKIPIRKKRSNPRKPEQP
jgi:2-amino-4-hydroxy-6-hydroxymethyldihydropteridine diphosphokinase